MRRLAYRIFTQKTFCIVLKNIFLAFQNVHHRAIRISGHPHLLKSPFSSSSHLANEQFGKQEQEEEEEEEEDGVERNYPRLKGKWEEEEEKIILSHTFFVRILRFLHPF